MEGNECYKFSTVANYLACTQGTPVRLAVDIGCNVGDVSALMRPYFPQAQIFGFEPVPDYYRKACEKLKDDAFAKVFRAAVWRASLPR